MEHSLKTQEKLLVFLTENMKEMELELRAQSIVLEALAEKIIAVDELKDALAWARNSTAMKEFVRDKYLLLKELCPLTERVQTAEEAAGWMEFGKLNELMN